MKILFVSHTANWAGAEGCLFQLLARLDPRRHEPLVILPGNGPLETRLGELGAPFRFGRLVHWIGRASTPDWQRFGTDLTSRVEALAATIEREQCDLVFTNTSVVFEGALAARLAGVPHLWRIHEMLSRHDDLRTRLSLARYYALLEKIGGRLCVVSDAVKQTLAAHVPPDRIEVVPNGIAPLEPPAAEPSRDIVYVGTLSEAKGVPLLAPVMQQVLARFPDARCLLVGEDAGAKRSLQRASAERRIEHAFRFLGFRRDALDVIAASRALILPSRVDSLPCVVMEAMALGVPVVATTSGGAAELVVEGETGHLVPVDDTDAMASALMGLLGDADRARAMGERGRERVRSLYSEDAYVSAFTDRFDELGGARAQPNQDARALAAELEAAARAS